MEIKRWIAYLYLYENGVKKNAAGFARLETRENSFNIILNAETSDKSVFTTKLYFACKQPGRIKGIYIGDAVFRNGKSDFTYACNVDNVGDSRIGADDLEGLLIYRDEDFYIASEWNDLKIISGNVKEITAEPQNISEVILPNEPENDSEVISFDEPENRFEVASVDEHENDFEVISADEPENECEAEPTLSEEPENEFEFIVAETLENNSERENNYERKEEEAQFVQTTNVEQFDRLFCSYPKLLVFEDGEYSDCVRIDLGVLSRLSQKDWFVRDKKRSKLEKNSFILHGFYRYRHLLLAKRAWDGKCLLLVPGMYYLKERNLAEMFGFGNFKCMKRKEPRIGEFGYWSIELTD